CLVILARVGFRFAEREPGNCLEAHDPGQARFARLICMPAMSNSKYSSVPRTADNAKDPQSSKSRTASRQAGWAWPRVGADPKPPHVRTNWALRADTRPLRSR